MAHVRLTATRREIRVQRSSGELVRRFGIGDGEDHYQVLARHRLRPVGRRHDLSDSDDGERFMVRVEPVEEEIYSGDFSVNLDHFHHQVVVWVGNERVSFLDDDEAREAARALTRTATIARESWGGER